MRADGTFTVESWDEKPYREAPDGRKLTRASVTGRLAGDITGTALTEWLMCYRPDGTADYVGLQAMDGQIGECRGSFVVRTEGTFDGSQAVGSWDVLEGSGTDELEGVRGHADFTSPKGTQATFSLEFELG